MEYDDRINLHIEFSHFVEVKELFDFEIFEISTRREYAEFKFELRYWSGIAYESYHMTYII